MKQLIQGQPFSLTLCVVMFFRMKSLSQFESGVSRMPLNLKTQVNRTISNYVVESKKVKTHHQRTFIVNNVKA